MQPGPSEKPLIRITIIDRFSQAIKCGKGAVNSGRILLASQ
jgi:hypothetical protein